MQHIFINCNEIVRPVYFTRYYNAQGETYQRLESAIDSSSFEKDNEAVRVELYENSNSGKVMPVLKEVIYRD
jgi:hypothetical protein